MLARCGGDDVVCAGVQRGKLGRGLGIRKQGKARTDGNEQWPAAGDGATLRDLPVILTCDTGTKTQKTVLWAL